MKGKQTYSCRSEYFIKPVSDLITCSCTYPRQTSVFLCLASESNVVILEAGLTSPCLTWLRSKRRHVSGYTAVFMKELAKQVIGGI